MTSKLTREELLNIIETDHVQCGEASALARMALAAMDSEPVEWLNGCNKSVPAALRYLAENPRPIGGESSFNTAHLYQLAREIELMAEAPLYRHAQPAPVVLDGLIKAVEFYEQVKRENPPVETGAQKDAVNWVLKEACRAAMLQENAKSAGESNNCRSSENVQDLLAGNCRENRNSSTNNCREIAETSTGTAITPAAPDKKLTDDVLDEIIAGAKTSLEQYLALSLKAEREVWRKEGPTDDERIMAIEGIHNCERCSDEGWVVGEMGITRCSCSQAGNSPAIPGCDGAELLPSTGEVIELNPDNNNLYTPLSTGFPITKEMIIAGQEELEACIDNGFDSDADGDRHDYTAIASDAPYRVFCAMLAAVPQEAK